MAESKMMKATELGGIDMPSDCENIAGFYIPPRAKTLKQLLQYTTVEHLLASHGQIVSILSSDTVQTALQTFRDHNVLSVPVYRGDGNSKFIGLLDTSDILEYFLSLNSDEWESKFFQTTIKDLVEVSKFNPTQMVTVGTSLLDVLGVLSKGDTHRVGVLDPNSNALFNIVSQMSLIQFLSRNISLLDAEMKNVPVSEFMKQIVQVENIPTDTITHKAFEYLFRQNISAAAVVDMNGKVTDTLSTSDIVGVLYDKFTNMHSIISLFLSSTRRTKAVKPPIVCKLSDTFEYTLLKLGSTKVHRLWVVDGDDNRYLGLVNLTNILFFCARMWLEQEDLNNI